MSQKIESEKLLIKDVFKKWFRIPEYQRPYVWEKDQVNELLDDIMQARNSNPDAQYFLGSMVLKKNEKTEGETKFIEYDLLDGQQRLTTLFLISAVIRDITPESNDTRLATSRDAVFQKANVDDNIPERMRIVFDIRDKVRDFITEFVKTEKGTLRRDELERLVIKKDEDISIKNMARAIGVIHEFFKDGKNNEFFSFLRSNVLMIYVAAEELDDAFRMFTVMNNRGVKLRNSDILKAENLGAIKNRTLQTQWARRWEEIEKYFGEDFDNFMSHIRTILVKKKAVSSLLKEYKENIYQPKEYDRNTKEYTPVTPLLKMGEETFKLVDKYYNHYQQLFEQVNSGLTNSFEIFNYLKLMRFGFEADFWIAPLLRYYDKFNVKDLLPFIKALDNKFANDWLVGYTPTDRIENINAVIQAIDDSKTTHEILNHKSLVLNDSELIETLGGKIYGKRAARYILLKLDLLIHGHTSKFDLPETISIEHILPQNPDAKSNWVKDFPEETAEEWTDKLGNLVLISRRKNSSQGNKDFEEKKEKYFRNNVELFSNSIRVFQNYSSWKQKDLEKNHKIVFTKLKEGFGLN